VFSNTPPHVQQARSRQQRYCSGRCQEKARRRDKKSFLTHDTGGPGEPPKKDSKLNELQRAKTLSSTRILAPADLIATEVWGGREWQPAISSSGVPIEMGRLRARALVERTR
jgi:hypothetical protein